MDRKEFLKSVGVLGVGTGICCLGSPAFAAQSTGAPTHSCQEKVEFSEGWVKRFMGVLDEGLDAETRARIMEANGKACARAYLKSIGREIKAVPFEEWAAKAKERYGDAVRVEGRTVYFQFTKNYQGLDAPEGACLCPLVESKPEGLSGTYCLCSVGYMKELMSQNVGRPVKVELLESVLRGGKRCRFKIEVA